MRGQKEGERRRMTREGKKEMNKRGEGGKEVGIGEGEVIE